MLRFAKPTCPIRTDRFSSVLFALGTAQLQPYTFICNLSFSKSSASFPRVSGQNCRASPFAEDSFGGVADPVCTSNEPLCMSGCPEWPATFVRNRRIQCEPKLPRSPFSGETRSTRVCRYESRKRSQLLYRPSLGKNLSDCQADFPQAEQACGNTSELPVRWRNSMEWLSM
jgi:hypothetical protein